MEHTWESEITEPLCYNESTGRTQAPGLMVATNVYAGKENEINFL